MATAPKTRKAASSPKSAAGRRKKAPSRKKSTAAKSAAYRDANTAFNDIDKLRDDLVRLSRNVSTLLTARGTEARDLVTDRATGLYDTGLDYARDAQAQVSGVATDVAKQVEKNPLAAVGIVFGVGYIIGLLRRK